MTAEAVDRATPDVDVGLDVGWLRDPRYDAALDRLVELQADQGRLYARQARVLALLAARTSREGWQGVAPFDSLLLDVAGSCVLGQVAAGSRLLDAEHLVVRLPGCLDALEDGRLRVHQAQVLVEQTRDLTPAVCAQVEQHVLGRAGGLCPADLRRLVKRTVLKVDAAAAARRERAARRDRKVSVTAAGDGMAWLGALLPAEQARLAFLSLTEQARAARAAGDRRTADQLRADLLTQQLTGVGCCLATSAPAVGGADCSWPAPVVLDRRSVRPVQVVVHVPLAVATGQSDAPAELDGHGPVSAWHARRLLEGAELRRACTDPHTGEIWALDPTVVRPVPTSTPATRRPEPAPTASSVPGRSRPPGGRRAAPRLERAGPVPGPEDRSASRGLHPLVDRDRDRDLDLDRDLDRDADDGPREDPYDDLDEDLSLDVVEPLVGGATAVDGPEPPVPLHVRLALDTLAGPTGPSPLPAEPQHDPSSALARLVRVRDVRCDGIGCSCPAARCELDHRRPWPAGATSADNLTPRSQRCHHAKHHGWTTARTCTGTTWTSPSGRSYLVPHRRPW